MWASTSSSEHCTVVTLLAFVLGWAMVLGANGAEDRVERLQDVRDTGWDMMKNTNPIGMLYWAFVGLAWVAVRAPSALSRFVSSVSQTARTLKQFIVGVLVYVHSEGRRIALTDTFFCTIVGSFVESAIIGVVVGAVVSYVDYELISVRLLKLIPARAK